MRDEGLCDDELVERVLVVGSRRVVSERAVDSVWRKGLRVARCSESGSLDRWRQVRAMRVVLDTLNESGRGRK